MPISSARAAREVRRAQLQFSQHVHDPRAPHRRHPLAGILSVFTAAMATGRLGLREVEALGDDLPLKILRRLGLTRGSVSDTAIYDILPRLREEEFRPVLWEQIRDDLDSKAITNDLFPGGVATFDGKCAGSGPGNAPNSQCRESVCDAAGTPYWDAFALRVCLTSSSARPVLDQEYILRKKNESSTFAPVFRRNVKQFPKLFRYVTTDAGLTSEANTKELRAAHKHYVLGLKANFNKLYPWASKALAQQPVLATTEQRAQGWHVCRELRRVTAPPGTKLADLTEFWGVRQIKTRDVVVETEDRVFAVSIPSDELNDEQRLRLVRLHWGIENGANWTADYLLREDTRLPCTAGKAVLVVGWLKLLAYNLVSVLRARLPAKDRCLVPWKRAAEIFYQALLHLRGHLIEPDATLC